MSIVDNLAREKERWQRFWNGLPEQGRGEIARAAWVAQETAEHAKAHRQFESVMQYVAENIPHAEALERHLLQYGFLLNYDRKRQVFQQLDRVRRSEYKRITDYMQNEAETTQDLTAFIEQNGSWLSDGEKQRLYDWWENRQKQIEILAIKGQIAEAEAAGFFWVIPALAAMLLLLLSGCSETTETPEPDPVPTPMPMPTEEPTATPIPTPTATPTPTLTEEPSEVPEILDYTTFGNVLKETGHFQRNSYSESTLRDLNRVLVGYGITEPQQLQLFLAVCMHESRLALTEAGWCSDEVVREYCLQYEPHTDKGKSLGNTEIGDGYKFRGAGYIQLTGRYNYQEFSDYIAEKYHDKRMS